MSDARPPEFSGEQPCPKCGYVHVATKYIGRNCRWLSFGQKEVEYAIWRSYPKHVEILERECRRCEYRWPESPLSPEQQGREIARAAFDKPNP